MTEDEPIEPSQELFPVGVKLSELVDKFPREETASRLVAIMIENGEPTADFYQQTGEYAERIKTACQIDLEKAVDENEKHALGIRAQLLHQTGLIILLLDTYWQLVDSGHKDQAEILAAEISDKSDELLGQLEMSLLRIESSPTLIHQDYFVSIQKMVEGLRSNS